jgi:hypothetical protein
VVGVLAVVAIQVEGEAAVLGKGAQKLREEFRVVGTDLLRHRSQVAREVAARPEIHNDRRQRLDERCARVGEAHDAAAVA